MPGFFYAETHIHRDSTQPDSPLKSEQAARFAFECRKRVAIAEQCAMHVSSLIGLLRET